MQRSPKAAVSSLSLAILATLAAAATGSAETWAEKLGWSASDRVLIRHADDAGMFPTANEAIQRGLMNGEIDSTSAMAPLHFFAPMMDWYRSHPDRDVGLHLTFTSEWNNYRWGPCADPPATVKRILNKHLVFRKETLRVFFLRAPTTVGREIQAQINTALGAMNPGRPECVPLGTDSPDYDEPPEDWELPPDCLAPTHLDSHMGSLYVRKSYFKKFLGRVLKNDLLPITFENFDETFKCLQSSAGLNMDKKLFKWHLDRLERFQQYLDTDPSWPYRRPFPRVDRYCTLAYGGTFAKTRTELLAFLDGLQAGITMVLFHPSDEGSLLKISTGGWERRVWDSKLFADPQVKAALAGIKTTTWREMTARCKARSICP